MCHHRSDNCNQDLGVVRTIDLKMSNTTKRSHLKMVTRDRLQTIIINHVAQTIRQITCIIKRIKRNRNISIIQIKSTWVIDGFETTNEATSNNIAKCFMNQRMQIINMHPSICQMLRRRNVANIMQCNTRRN